MRDRKDRTIRSQGEGGFTLAEVLVATTLSTMVLLGLYLLYDVNQATFIRGEQRTDLQQNARIGMDRLVRELRLVGSDPAIIPAPCATAILSATPTSITFIANVDSDAATEKVEYTHDPACTPNCTVDPPKLRREEWPSLAGPNCTTDWSPSGGAQPLADRVTTLTFAYYTDANNCVGGTCGIPPVTVLPGSLKNIRRISVLIKTEDQQTGSVPHSFDLRAEVRPRNLGLSP